MAIVLRKSVFWTVNTKPTWPSRMNKQEDFQNRALALLLSTRGVVADYEQRAGRRRMDIVAEVEGLRVVLEAETGFHRKAQAIKDADARLRQRLATVVFAVCYPDGVTEDDLAEATLTWTVRMKAGEPSGEWSTGDVSQLAQAVQRAPRSLSGADMAAQMLSDGLDAVVQRLKTRCAKPWRWPWTFPQPSWIAGSKGTGTSSPPSAECWLWLRPCCFINGSKAIFLTSGPAVTMGSWPPASATGMRRTGIGHQRLPRGLARHSCRGLPPGFRDRPRGVGGPVGGPGYGPGGCGAWPR